MHTRRTFLKSSATLTAAFPFITFPRILPGSSPYHDARVAYDSIFNDSYLKSLAKRGVEAAQRAGAEFADVRITKSKTITLDIGSDHERISESFEAITVGIRALVNGRWGGAGGSVCTLDELSRLGREAVAQAKAIGGPQRRPCELAVAPVVNDQQWVMPIKIDPWKINLEAVIDFIISLNIYAERTPNVIGGGGRIEFYQQNKVYASTEGSLCTQQTYRTSAVYRLGLKISERQRITGGITVSPTGEGWEGIYDLPWHDMIDREIERLHRDHKLPWMPVEVGKYPVIFDARSVTNLLSETIGSATEIDRAMGYEANASGTSYLTDPLEMTGTFMVGSPLLSVVGNRSAPKGVATVQWDDDGVVPDEIPLITNGRVTDFSTSRESATWLTPVYARLGKPVRSHGCAYAPEGVDIPLVHTPNLVMTPGNSSDTLETFIEGMNSGFLFCDFSPLMDMQQLSGIGFGRCYEIKHGKRVSRVANAGVLFRTPELWKNITAIGSDKSAERWGIAVTKGEPAQTSYHSVTAVPMVIKEMNMIDVSRKA
jgi:TldD protein